MERIRKQIEPCDSLQGILLTNSMGGGTGAGIGELVLNRLVLSNEKKDVVGFNLIPSDISNSVVEPYNFVQSIESFKTFQNLSILMDNQSLYDILRRSNI